MIAHVFCNDRIDTIKYLFVTYSYIKNSSTFFQNILLFPTPEYSRHKVRDYQVYPFSLHKKICCKDRFCAVSYNMLNKTN